MHGHRFSIIIFIVNIRVDLLNNTCELLKLIGNVTKVKKNPGIVERRWAELVNCGETLLGKDFFTLGGSSRIQRSCRPSVLRSRIWPIVNTIDLRQFSSLWLVLAFYFLLLGGWFRLIILINQPPVLLWQSLWQEHQWKRKKSCSIPLSLHQHVPLPMTFNIIYYKKYRYHTCWLGCKKITKDIVKKLGYTDILIHIKK